jgi:hypothetical protein
MAVPKKVREQGEAADAALKALDAERAAQGVAGSGQDGNPGGTPNPPVAVAPVPGLIEPGQGGSFNWQAEAEAQKAEAERLKHSLSVLQGKYNSEIGPLNEEVRNLKAGYERLKQQAAAPAAAVPPGKSGVLTKEQLEEIRDMFGDTMANALEAVTANAANSALAAVQPKLEVLAKSDSDAKYAEMNKRIAAIHPDWEMVDQAATWIAFINQVDEATGLPRRTTIERAFHQFNEKPLTLAMTQFKRQSGGGGLEAQVVPVSSGRGQEGTPAQDGSTYRRRDVEEFYVRATEKLKRGHMTKDEYTRLDRIYTEAEIQGRVIG